MILYMKNLELSRNSLLSQLNMTRQKLTHQILKNLKKTLKKQKILLKKFKKRKRKEKDKSKKDFNYYKKKQRNKLKTH